VLVSIALVLLVVVSGLLLVRLQARDELFGTVAGAPAAGPVGPAATVSSSDEQVEPRQGDAAASPAAGVPAPLPPQAAAVPGQVPSEIQAAPATTASSVEAARPVATGVSTCPRPDQVVPDLTEVRPAPEAASGVGVVLEGRVVNGSAADISLHAISVDLYDAAGNPLESVTLPLSGSVPSNASAPWSATAEGADPSATKGALHDLQFRWADPAHAACPPAA
jgi:hypothetical protein